MTKQMPTVLDLLEEHAVQQAQQDAYIFLKNGETEHQRINFSELYQQALQFAAYLQTSTSPGSRVLLIYPCGIDFTVALFGCFFAGVVAVPLTSPAPRRSKNRGFESLSAIIDDTQAALILSSSVYQPRFTNSALPCPCIYTDQLDKADGVYQETTISANDIALLQYTSGSTRSPKGVIIRHQALSEQLAYYQQRAGKNCRQYTMVGWLPHYHDFGLIGFILSAAYMGVPYYFMSPAAFLQKPIRWLNAISKYQASYSGGPNFALQLCLDKIKDSDCHQLNLNTLLKLSVGGEPIRHQTLQQFIQRFQSYGLDPNALLTTYGLAEAVLCVSSRQGLKSKSFDYDSLLTNKIKAAKSNSTFALQLVSCGTTLSGQEVIIVDPDQYKPCPNDHIGEIWFYGKSIASGYWNQVDETKMTFAARLLSGQQKHPCLRTGDLGFIHEGELYITGRLKDIIIVRGKNHCPQDIEQSTQNYHPQLRRDSGAAFLLDSNAVDPKLVIVQEVDRSFTSLPTQFFPDLRRTIAEVHGLNLHAIELIKPFSLPKTSSGKIRRGACRTAFIEKTLSSQVRHVYSTMKTAVSINVAELPDAVETKLLSLLKDILPGRPIGVNDNFFDLGVDSLAAQLFIGKVQETYAIELPVRHFFEQPSLSQLASIIRDHLPDQANQIDDMESLAPAILQELKSLNALMTDQTQLLRKLLSQRSDLNKIASASKANKVKHFDASSLTDSQKETLFLMALDDQAQSVYTVYTVVEFKIAVDMAKITAVFHDIALRHESLRTVFGQQTQKVLPKLLVDIQHLDLSNKESFILEQHLKQQRQQPFDLAQGPLWRCLVLQLAKEQCLLVLTAHHLIADGWSFHIILQEFADYYAGIPAQSDPVLPMQAYRYREIQHDYRQSSKMAKHQQYWLQLFSDKIPQLDLPTEQQRPDSIKFNAQCFSLKLDSKIYQQIQQMAGQHDCTIMPILLSAYLTLLHHWSGQSELLVGIDSAARVYPGSEQLVAATNTLIPFLSDHSNNPSVSQFIRWTRQQLLDAYEHQEYRFVEVLEKLRIATDPKRPFKINATFNMQRPLHDNPVFAHRLDLQAQTVTHSPLEIAFEATDLGNQIHLDIVYNNHLFDQQRIRTIAQWYQKILCGILDDPTAAIFSLPYLSDTEQHHLLHDLAELNGPENQCLFIDTFEGNVDHNPDAIAIVDESCSLSYRQLNHKANQLAWTLIEHDTKPGMIIGLLADRNAHYLIALLAILKSGATYIPFDPRDPQDRIKQLINQSQCQLLLVTDQLKALLAKDLLSLDQAPVIVSLEQALDTEASTENPSVCLQVDDPAYVIYTSGSTGEPKGAIVSHAGMINHLQAKVDVLAITNQDIMAQTASACFDISIWQFLCPLLVGGRIRVFDDVITHDPHQLLLQIDQQKITLLEVVPSMLRAVLEQAAILDTRRPRLSQLRWLIPTGETLLPELCRRWIAFYPRVPLLNAYGPTECSDDVSHYAIHWPPQEDVSHIPIGRPIAGAKLYILDQWQQLAPLGTPGELYISGVCTGLGYLNDPQRTAESFLPNPFSPGDKMYKTGDLVQYAIDDNLQFLGRIDQQVKIQGVRIEPQEIEVVLLQHPSVCACVVSIIDHPDSPYLAAYVVYRENAVTSVGSLRFYVRNHLPSYMVPRVITVMDALPQNSNGKIDKSALPIPAETKSTKHITPAKTALEKQLSGIWTEVLEHNNFGIHDDLFELGGRSLDVVKIVSEIKGNLQTDIPVSQIYRAPTVAELAMYIENAEAAVNTSI